MGILDGLARFAPPGMVNRMRSTAQVAFVNVERGFTKAVHLAAEAAVSTVHRTSLMPMGQSSAYGSDNDDHGAYGDSVSVNDLLRERFVLPPNNAATQLQPVNVPTWTIPEVRSALDTHELGTFFSSTTLVDAMGRDDRIDACLGTRVGALAGKSGIGFTVAPAEDVADGEQAETIANKVQSLWQYSCPENVMSHVLKDGVMLGVAFAKIHWDLKDGMRVPRLEPWHAHTVYFDWSILKYRVVAREGMMIIEPGNAEWFVYEPGGWRSWMTGAVRGLGIPFVIRQYTYRDWYRYCEKHGMPILAIKEPVGAMWEKHKQGFWGKVQRLGTESTLRLPFSEKDNDGFGVSFVEPKDKSWQTFQAMIGELNTNIAIRLLGQNLSTEVKGGSFAAAASQELVRLDYLDRDANTLSGALREQVWSHFVRFNYDAVSTKYTPVPTWDTRPPEDKKAKAEVVKIFAEAMKILVDPDVRRLAPANIPLIASGMGIDFLDKPGFALEQKELANNIVNIKREVPAQDMLYGILTKNEIRKLAYGLGPIKDGNAPTVAIKPQDPPIEAKADGTADVKKPELFAYHLEYGIVSKNEARRIALGLPPAKGGDVPAIPMLPMPVYPNDGKTTLPATAPIDGKSGLPSTAPVAPVTNNVTTLAMVAAGGTGKHGSTEEQRVIARSAVNQKVRSGKLPHPNSVPCVDCGHAEGSDACRHEYDHTKGYSAEHHLDVESVCTACHKKRSLKEYGRLYALNINYETRLVCGIEVTIDRPKGTVQSGVDANGVAWTRTYSVDYGFIAHTLGGIDGEAIDVYVGPVDDAPLAWWIVQTTQDGLAFDEYKLMLAYTSKMDALASYGQHTPLSYVGNIFSMPVAAIRGLLDMDPQERLTVLNAARFTPSEVVEATAVATGRTKRGSAAKKKSKAAAK